MKNKLLPIIGLAALVLAIATIIFPVFPGIERVAAGTTETFRAYDFVFGNSAIAYAKESNGAMIGAFILNIIALVFCLAGTIFVLADGTKKFGAFLLIVGGGSVLATGIIYILAKSIIDFSYPATATFNLKFGFLGSGIAGIASGALGLFGGFLGMASKN